MIDFSMIMLEINNTVSDIILVFPLKNYLNVPVLSISSILCSGEKQFGSTLRKKTSSFIISVVP